jgi:hypothetical protein
VVTAAQAGLYLEEYVRRYRSEYARFVAPPPTGGGYPPLQVSPYLHSESMQCYLAVDGAVVLDMSREPPYDWHVAGGPALMADFPTTRTPPWVTDALNAAGILGKPIGIYRVVSQVGIPEPVWQGRLGDPSQLHTANVDQLVIEVFRFRYSWSELIRRLTFGALDLILDMHLPAVSAEFWNPRIIRNMGFFPADRNARRFFDYAELLRHTERAAWDERSAWARAHVDLRRDFAHAITAGKEIEEGGSLSLTGPEPPIGPRFHDRLEALRVATKGLEDLLQTQSAAPEAVFHQYLVDNAVLLDVYGTAESKPRFEYPEGERPLGKSYVEPDFVIRYTNQTYKLVELERPAHGMATQAGHPRVAVTHAAFQIAEWKDFIQRHYDLIKTRFPGIAGSYSSMIVISRDTERSFGAAADKNRYIAILRQQVRVEEVLTYDDLVSRARRAIVQLTALSDSLVTYPREDKE